MPRAAPGGGNRAAAAAFVVSLSHIILSRLGAHILTGTLLDRHARQHLGEQSCTNPLSFSFSPDCSLVASASSTSCIPPLATHSMGALPRAYSARGRGGRGPSLENEEGSPDEQET